MEFDMIVDTAGRMANQLIRDKPDIQNAGEWVVTFRATGGWPKLFCVCAGGGDTLTTAISRSHCRRISPYYGFGMPPSMAGSVFPTVEQLAAVYIEEVRRRQPHGPYSPMRPFLRRHRGV